MSGDRVKVDWMVPADEWELVMRECGDLKGECSRRVEAAMREYAGVDGCLEEVEDRLRAGFEGCQKEKEKIPPSEPHQSRGVAADGGQAAALANKEKIRARPHVDPDVLAAFKNRADDADDNYGVELARALRQYRTKSRDDRLLSLVEALGFGPVTEDDSMSPADVDTDPDTDNVDAEDSEFSLTERRTHEVIDTLEAKGITEYHLEKDIKPAVAAVDGLSDDPTPSVVEDYADRVADHLDLREHPMNPQVLAPSEELPERPDHKPWECWIPVSQIKGDPDARARRVTLELGRRAAKDTSGAAGMSLTEIHDEILDGEFSKPSVRTTVEEIADTTPGFRRATSHGSGKTLLKANLESVADHDKDLFAEIIQYRDGEPEAPDPGDGQDAITTADATVDGWDDRAVDRLGSVDDLAVLPEKALNVAIVRAQHPDTPEDIYIEDDVLGAVTDEERQRVRDALRDAATDDDGDDTADLKATADERLAQLEQDQGRVTADAETAASESVTQTAEPIVVEAE